MIDCAAQRPVLSVNNRCTDWARFEWPFWFAMAYAAWLPATVTPWVTLVGIPVNSKDILLLIAAFIYLFHRRYPRRSVLKPCCWHGRLHVYLGLLLCYAAVSMLWARLDTSSALASFYTLMLTAAAAVLGYLLVTNRSSQSLNELLWRATVFLAFTGGLYFAASYVGWGSRAEMAEAWTEFGIARVRGPLFSASTGHFILVPAFAFAVQEALRGTASRRGWAFAVSLCLAVVILGLGSRSAVLCFALFLLMLGLLLRNRRQRIAAVGLVVLVIMIGAGLVFSRASVQRLGSFDDPYRLINHLTCWNIVSHRSVISNLAGAGYGRYWQWYITETEFRDSTTFGLFGYLVWTDYGPLLHHPHSLPLLLVVELGLPGVLFLVLLWHAILKALFAGIRDKCSEVLLCGIVASCPAMFFDLFLFKKFHLGAFWWLFVFGAFAVLHSTRRRRSSEVKQ